MATTVWKGSITFGLVSIPIRLYAAARPRRIELHQLHNKCHTRLKQPPFCPTCNRFVERSEVVTKEYRDEFQERLSALIEAKLKGLSIAAAPEAPRAPVIDIMQALKKSFGCSRQRRRGSARDSRSAGTQAASQSQLS